MLSNRMVCMIRVFKSEANLMSGREPLVELVSDTVSCYCKRQKQCADTKQLF